MARINCDRIIKLRKEKDLTQLDMGQQFGVSQPAWHKIETGLSEISAVRIYEIARFFNVPVESLFIEG